MHGIPDDGIIARMAVAASAFLTFESFIISSLE
jgi:hypothetical protein